MKLILTLFLISQIFVISFAQETEGIHSSWKALEEGNELSIPTDHGKIDRISISFKNVLDKESMVYWTKYKGDNEMPENEIGPRKYRTITLTPKITDENETIRLDKKKIVLDTNKADKIIVKVEKGKVEVLVENMH